MPQRYDENLILGYLEDDLTPPQRADFEAQLAADPPLRELVQAMAKDRAALRAMPIESPPAGMMQTVHERLERTMLLDSPPPPTALPIARHRTRMTRVLVITAIAALLLLVAGLVLQVWLFTLGIPEPVSMTPMAIKSDTPATASTPTWERQTPVSPSAEAPAAILKTDETKVATLSSTAPGSPPGNTSGIAPAPGTAYGPVAAAPGEQGPDASALDEPAMAASLAMGEKILRQDRGRDSGAAVAARAKTAAQEASVAGTTLNMAPKTADFPMARLLHLRVMTGDPRMARTELEQWALANQALIYDLQAPAQTVGPIVESRMEPAARQAPPSTSTREQLYADTLLPDSVRALPRNVPPVESSAQSLVVNISLPAGQMPSLLHQLTQVPGGRTVQLLHDADASPSPPQVPSHPDATVSGKKQDSSEMVQVMVEFVELEPAEAVQPRIGDQ